MGQDSTGVAGAIRKLRRQLKNSVGSIRWETADPSSAEGPVMWGFDDGRLRYRTPSGTIFQIATTTPGSSSGPALPADPQPELLQKTYAATFGQTYCGTHGVETGAFIGYGDSADGAHTGRQVMIGLPYATIQTDLAGAVIRDVELRMVNMDAWADTVTLEFGWHNSTSAPAAYTPTRLQVDELIYPRTGTGEEWRDLAIAFGRQLRDNQAKGLVIDQPPGLVNGGSFDWASVTVRITYSV